jgi:hypothetical protein
LQFHKQQQQRFTRAQSMTIYVELAVCNLNLPAEVAAEQHAASDHRCQAAMCSCLLTTSIEANV